MSQNLSKHTTLYPRVISLQLPFRVSGWRMGGWGLVGHLLVWQQCEYEQLSLDSGHSVSQTLDPCLVGS